MSLTQQIFIGFGLAFAGIAGLVTIGYRELRNKHAPFLLIVGFLLLLAIGAYMALNVTQRPMCLSAHLSGILDDVLTGAVIMSLLGMFLFGFMMNRRGLRNFAIAAGVIVVIIALKPYFLCH